MALSYNLTYRKTNIPQRLFIEKDGEVLLYPNGIRLKGKGALDRGELISFTDVKEFQVNEEAESLRFTTFKKDEFEVLHFGGIFRQFLLDFFKLRNEFLIEALFLKQGALVTTFEAHFERATALGKIIAKGKGQLRLFEESLVIVPEASDVFALPFSFIQSSECDAAEYRCRIVTDAETEVTLSQLGNHFSEFQEQLTLLLNHFYDRIVQEFQYVLTGAKMTDLAKLSSLVKGGKAVSLKKIQKIDKTLAQQLLDYACADEAAKKKLQLLGNFPDPDSTHLGITVRDGKHDQYIVTVMHAMPADNLIALLVGAKNGAHVKMSDLYLFRIVMEEGIPTERVPHKVMELNQALLYLHFVTDPLYRDKRELRRSPYRFAIRKLPFLRLLRKSYVSRAPIYADDLFEKYLTRAKEKAKMRVLSYDVH